MDVQLDKSVLKALSNDKRVEILKELQRRRFTQSELAEELELSVPTVKEHLTALEKAGLVEMHDEGRKWKYYSLTKKSKAILQPESVNIFIVLATFVLSIVGGVYSYIVSLPSKAAAIVPEAFGAAKGIPMQAVPEAVAASANDAMVASADNALGASANELVRTTSEEVVRSAAQPTFLQLYGLWIFAGCAVISIVLLFVFLSRRARMRKSLGKSLNKK